MFSIMGIVAILFLAFILLQTYVKRGVQGRLKSASDDIGSQYEPYYSGSSYGATSQSLKTISSSTVNSSNSQIIRKVIRNANVSLKVKDAQQVQLDISSIITKSNGIVVNSSLNRSSGGAKTGSIVFKILPKDLDNILRDIKILGDVESEGKTGEDVTEQYVDLQARLQNYKLVKDRLIKILDERAREVKDILEVEKEMARVGSEIESLEGKIKFLDQQTDMATVSVYFYETRIRVFSGINFGDKFNETLHVSAETFVNTFNGIIIVFAFIIPIAFWLFLGWGAWLVIRRIIKR